MRRLTGYSLIQALQVLLIWIVAAFVCLTSLAAGEDPAASPAFSERDFAVHIWPLLQERCLPCHGSGKELAGGLDLRSAAAALRGGDSGQPAWIAKNKSASPLWRAVMRTDDEFSAMPPKENDQLKPNEIDAIGRWIAAGAPWPNEQRLRELSKATSKPGSEAVEVATSGGQNATWTNRKYQAADLWAYRPLQMPLIPEAPPGLHPVDSFLWARQQELKLPLAPRADRRTLIRRVTLDLIGLPPTLDEVADFVADPRDDSVAYSRLIDRLLASPHYGEHWARHWLDVVRYADSSGFANDYERGNAWRYRDYVIRAFNSDKPYDQFIQEQIAGDEIDPENVECLIATGFLRMGPWELTGMEVPKIARQRFLDDVTDIVGQTFLAHALQCARCHDHKFDPVPTGDYYRIQAVFATTQLVEREAAFLPEENRHGFAERRFLEQRQQRYQKLLSELTKKEELAARRWCEERGFEYIPRQQGLKRGIPEERLPPKHVGFSVADYGVERITRKGLERLRWELERYEPWALAVYSGPTPTLKSVLAPVRMPKDLPAGTIEKTAILAGGDPFSPTSEVVPGALSAVENLCGPDGPRFPSLEGAAAGRRTALARWIADARNPLTPRVMANRVWQWHFGRGLAENANNFGTTGKKPSHPELLDWLAATLIKNGWSLKSLHRVIMTSEAYQRSCDHSDSQELIRKDPSLSSYAAFRPRRLSAEEIRDSQLAASGELNRAVGGIPARPEIHQEIALQPRQVMGTFASAWQPSPFPSDRHRRSIYTLRIRGLREPMGEVFNEPSADLSCEGREVSLVTPQVFALFNSKLSYDRALVMAANLIRESANASDALDRAFYFMFGRRPTAEEAATCLTHWNKMSERHRNTPLPDVTVAKEVIRSAVEENTGERFEFVEELEFVVEYVPDIQPSELTAEVRGLAETCLVLFNTNEFMYVY